MRIVMRIRVTTGADLFEERKQQHVNRGYRIEDERPIPVNGLCALTAIARSPLPIHLATSSCRRSVKTTAPVVTVEVSDLGQDRISLSHRGKKSSNARLSHDSERLFYKDVPQGKT